MNKNKIIDILVPLGIFLIFVFVIVVVMTVLLGFKSPAKKSLEKWNIFKQEHQCRLVKANMNNNVNMWLCDNDSLEVINSYSE